MNRRETTGASLGQIILAGCQVVLCGWFFALCVSDVLDFGVNFSAVRVILDFFYALAFLSLSVYAQFTKHKNDDRDLKTVIATFIALIGAQCIVFPYEKEQQMLRIFESVEGAVVFGLLIAVMIRLHDDSFCRKSLVTATALEFIVAIENVVVPFADITGDFQLIDIPLNYLSLFMRPILFASLTLTYRVWLDKQKALK